MVKTFTYCEGQDDFAHEVTATRAPSTQSGNRPGEMVCRDPTAQRSR
jgi:hypothetical protein